MPGARGHRATALRSVVDEARLRRKTELAYRAYRAVVARSGWLERRFPAVTPTAYDLYEALRPGVARTPADYARLFDERHTPVFFGLAGVDDGTYRRHLGVPSDLLGRADEIMERRFRVFGTVVHFPAAVDWHHCVNVDGSWPRRHWSRLSTTHSGGTADVRACWELNRHQSMVTLGRAYRATGDATYVDCFEELLTGWCDQNPPEVGINYFSNMELGLRCLSWMWAHHLFAPAVEYRPECRLLLHAHVYYMARHLAKNLRYSEVAARNNHLIGDAACLAMVATMYPEIASAARWRSRALDVLWRAVRRQVLSDGLHFELSFGYHRFVSELVLQVTLLLNGNGADVPPDITGRLAAMLEALVGVVQPDGTHPNVNDDDSGTAFPFLDRSVDRLSALLDAGHATVGSRGAIAAATRSPPETMWLTGRTDTPAERGSAIAGGTAPVAFPASGFYVVRSSPLATADYLLFDNHRDPFPGSGHNHASLLQVLLWIAGRPVLIDGGTFRYNGDQGLRNPLRSTAAHNTVAVDGRSQAVPTRTFGWASRLAPGPTTCLADERHVVLDGYHDSYRSLAEPVRHRRTLVWLREERTLLVVDRFTGTGRHRFDQRWHFPQQSWSSVPSDGVLSVDTNGSGAALVHLFPEPGDSAHVNTGDGAEPVSWSSPTYGVLEPRTTIRRTWSATVPTERVSAFSLHEEQAGSRLTVERPDANRLVFPRLAVTIVITDGDAVVEHPSGPTSLR